MTRNTLKVVGIVTMALLLQACGEERADLNNLESIPADIVKASVSNGITVNSPSAGNVATTFTLNASASSCSGQSIASMGYSIDSGSTTVFYSNSINTSVSTSTGSHVLHVKSWGTSGAGCDNDVSLNAVANGVVVNSPGNGSLASPFMIQASSLECAGQSVVSMGYSFDSGATTVFNGQSISTVATSNVGNHVLHVKSWGSGGAGCDTDVSLDVTSSKPYVASNATVVSNIQDLSTWELNNDPGTPGSSTGSTWVIGSPSLSGAAREFYMYFNNSGGEIFHDAFGADTNATHFVYDTYFYIESTTNIANIEMDMNQVMSNGNTVIYGMQCDGNYGVWDYTKNTGSVAKPVDTWIHSGLPCNPQSWSINTWHHIQMAYYRDSSGNVTYQSVWFDGVESDFNVTVPSAFALGWGSALLTNFQIDGRGSSGQTHAILDKLTVSRW